MTDETRPFAEIKPESSVADAEGFSVVIEGEECCPPWGNWTEKGATEYAVTVNAAHESRCQSRERRAAVKALREAADSEALKDDFGHGEVITKHDVRTALRAEAAAIERGEVAP